MAKIKKHKAYKELKSIFNRCGQVHRLPKNCEKNRIKKLKMSILSSF